MCHKLCFFLYLGPAPTLESRVQLKWPDHLVILREREVREMEDFGLVPLRLQRHRAGKEGRGGEEVVVYHSVANDRLTHMVDDGESENKVSGMLRLTCIPRTTYCLHARRVWRCLDHRIKENVPVVNIELSLKIE